MKEKRPLIYISHPFTGDPEGNRESARKITAFLSKECGFNNYIFINPLDLFLGQSMVANLDASVLSQAVEVMLKCDGVVFCDGWRKSRGCRVEHRKAYKAGLPRWDGPEAFVAGFNDRTPYEFWCKVMDAAAQSRGYENLKDYLDKRLMERRRMGYGEPGHGKPGGDAGESEGAPGSSQGDA